MNLFHFENYRVYLKNWIAHQPRKGRGLILKLAKEVNIQSTQVSQILAGRKDFTSDQALKLSLYLNHSELETEYFLLMVQRERAGSHLLANYSKDRMEHLKKQSLDLDHKLPKDKILSEAEKSIFYSSWLYAAVRLYCSVGEGQSFASIQKRFHLKEEKLQDVLKFLIDTQLIKQESDSYKIGPLRTNLDASSKFASRNHSNWRLISIRKTEERTPDDLLFTGPITLNRKDFHRIRDLLGQAISKSLEIVNDSPAEDLACLNVDLYWVPS